MRALHSYSEQADLGGIRQFSEGARVLEHLDVGFRHLGAGGGDLLDGDEVLALSSLHQVDGSIFAQAGDGHEGGQDLVILDEELRRMALIQVDGGELEAPEVELVDDLQGGQQILVLGGCILVLSMASMLALVASSPAVIRAASKPPF